MTPPSTSLALASAMAALLPFTAAHAAEKAPKGKAPIERQVETFRVGPEGAIICTGDEPVCEAIDKAGKDGENVQFRVFGDAGQGREINRVILRRHGEDRLDGLGGLGGLGPRAFAFSPEARGPRSVTQCTRGEAKETAPGVKTYTLTCTERQIGENEVVFLDRGGPGFPIAPPAPAAPPAPPSRP